MIDIKSISNALIEDDMGIWRSKDTQDISYSAEGNNECFAVEDNSFWFKHRNDCIVSAVKQYNTNNDTIFDIGGGNGFVSLGLQNAGFDVAVVEPGRHGANNAKNRGLKNVICATTDTAEFKPNSLPSVGLFDVIEHIEKDINFLISIRQLMQKDGYLYATVPAYNFLWSDEDVNAGHFRRYTVKRISEVLNKAGFEIQLSTYIFRFIPLPIFLFRALPNKFGFSNKKKNTNKTADVHIVKSGIKVKILNSLLKSEINNINNKINMKFGGSCLIVAKAL
jgi:hypothetical protein